MIHSHERLYEIFCNSVECFAHDRNLGSIPELRKIAKYLTDGDAVFITEAEEPVSIKSAVI